MTAAATPGRLRAVREAQGRSLEDVARATGYDKGYISRVERGLQRPTVDFLRIVLRELNQDLAADAIERFWP